MALLDQVTQGMQKLGAPEEQAGAATNQTQAAARLASGLTGKATSGAGPQMSNLQEQVAQNQARIAAEQQAKSQQVAAEQLATSEQQQQEEMQLDTEGLDEARIEQMDRYTQKATSLLNDFTREGRTLNLKKDGAKLEQLGHVMRMADDKYRDELERVGAMKRLDDQAAFEEEIMNATFNDERELRQSSVAFRRLMDADEREFQSRLQEMSINDGIEFANAQAEAENSRQFWTGLGNLGTAGISAAATAYTPADKPSEPAPDIAPAPAPTPAGTPSRLTTTPEFSGGGDGIGRSSTIQEPEYKSSVSRGKW